MILIRGNETGFSDCEIGDIVLVHDNEKFEVIRIIGWEENVVRRRIRGEILCGKNEGLICTYKQTKFVQKLDKGIFQEAL